MNETETQYSKIFPLQNYFHYRIHTVFANTLFHNFFILWQNVCECVRMCFGFRHQTFYTKWIAIWTKEWKTNRSKRKLNTLTWRHLSHGKILLYPDRCSAMEDLGLELYTVHRLHHQLNYRLEEKIKCTWIYRYI